MAQKPKRRPSTDQQDISGSYSLDRLKAGSQTVTVPSTHKYNCNICSTTIYKEFYSKILALPGQVMEKDDGKKRHALSANSKRFDYQHLKQTEKRFDYYYCKQSNYLFLQ
jgi:hypothetical protein